MLGCGGGGGMRMSVGEVTLRLWDLRPMEKMDEKTAEMPPSLFLPFVADEERESLKGLAGGEGKVLSGLATRAFCMTCCCWW